MFVVRTDAKLCSTTTIAAHGVCFACIYQTLPKTKTQEGCALKYFSVLVYATINSTDATTAALETV